MFRLLTARGKMLWNRTIFINTIANPLMTIPLDIRFLCVAHVAQRLKIVPRIHRSPHFHRCIFLNDPETEQQSVACQEPFNYHEYVITRSVKCGIVKTAARWNLGIVNIVTLARYDLHMIAGLLFIHFTHNVDVLYHLAIKIKNTLTSRSKTLPVQVHPKAWFSQRAPKRLIWLRQKLSGWYWKKEKQTSSQ